MRPRHYPTPIAWAHLGVAGSRRRSVRDPRAYPTWSWNPLRVRPCLRYSLRSNHWTKTFRHSRTHLPRTWHC